MKPLIKTNLYLKDPAKRQALLYTVVSSSTAIEGVHVVFTKEFNLPKPFKKPTFLHEFEASDESQF
jgi:hypothetical protein